MGYGLGGLFHSVARAVMPMVKSGAKALGNIALKSDANFVGDVAKKKAVNKLMNQTGSGKRGWKQTAKKTC